MFAILAALVQAEVRRLTDRIERLETQTPPPPVPPTVPRERAAPYVPPPPLTALPVDIEAIGGRVPIRYFAMALFGVSLLKIFLIDLATVGGIYRVIGFLVVGVVLVLVSFLYQRVNVSAEPKT